MTTPPHIAILGLGLIGSSVARACRKAYPNCHITAFDSNPLTLQYAEQHGFVDAVSSDAEHAVAKADVVVIAAPPSAALEMVALIAPCLPPTAVVTDVVSIKAPIALAMQQHLTHGAAYVPAHPIAGSEQAGVAAGKADLFVGKRVILTPLTPEDAGIPAVRDFWQALGGYVEYMPPDMHDVIYAHVSHLPQLLAFALKPQVEQHLNAKDMPTHLQAFTRLCHSDKHLWDDIFLHNKAELDQALARFLVFFTQIRKELAEGEHHATPPDMGIQQAEIWGELMPCIIASCLIGTVAEQSKQAGFAFARFAGSGFADFTAPLRHNPEQYLEKISQHTKDVCAAMDTVLDALLEQCATYAGYLHT